MSSNAFAASSMFASWPLSDCASFEEMPANCAHSPERFPRSMSVLVSESSVVAVVSSIAVVSSVAVVSVATVVSVSDDASSLELPPQPEIGRAHV